MSFDLYFYTKKGQSVPEESIVRWLETNGCVREDAFPQWLYSNESTGVYFIFEKQPESEEPDEIELFESFDEFENTRFTFNLNFIRPNFFGLEAFPFVESFISDLDLYALNPQSKTDGESPRKETADQYYSDWSRANLNASGQHFDEFGLTHFPIEKSCEYWRYNFHVPEMQERLGENYFVPSLILARLAKTKEPITLTTWTQHIPNVFPPADYFVIIRKLKKLFRTIDETGVISRQKFDATFGNYLEPFDFKDCRIIHPEHAEAVARIFNEVEFDSQIGGLLAESIELESFTNAERPENRTFLDSGN
jgi:hypothetical protein